ncbi:hypothetical protein H114_00652 [Streptomyces gancidicus BKS 13-15]|uniref:Uncharacterized protein n=1 Tax=Streptomyces gancidicus BKS 13-15 TaxID=1284664 RepID=M3D3Y1_STREZ|nr:hypothetical protein [Streptomyces gancidicus]EMF31093.1 hypothetical protein H114_00652 [Streptomyces gancidicus BKS 13-15]
MARVMVPVVTDQEIARRLTSPEVSNLSVARDLGVSWGRVEEVRRQLELPTYRRGRRVPESTWQEAVQRRVKETSDGHAEWTGNRHPNGTPLLSWRGRTQTAYRVVFRLHHAREPEGNITHVPDCQVEHCVAGGHLEDRRMRDRRRAAGDAR